MKSKLLLFLIINISINISLSAKEEQIPLKSKNGISIGMQAYKYRYEEEVDGSTFMSTEGAKYGLVADGTIVFGKKGFLNTEARYSKGYVKYKGSETGDVSEDMFEIRLAVGSEEEIGNYLLGFYSGLGYRVLKNNLQELGDGGYQRKSYYTYLPIGAFHRFHLGDSGRLSTKLEYDFLLEGEQKSNLSDINPAYSDVTNEQNSGYGLKLSTAYEEKNWSFGLFFNYWEIEDSEEVEFYPNAYAMEPKNHTLEYGVDMRIRF